MPSTANVFAVAQGLLGARVIARMIATRGGVPVEPTTDVPDPAEAVCAIVPVLNEAGRLWPCLEALSAAPAALTQIIVVDGGSTDGTRELVAAAARREPRITLVDAAPVPSDWNGKAWNLRCGLAASDPDVRWIVTLDADVRPTQHVIASLLAHARRYELDAFSAAPLLLVTDPLEAALHPAFLATLVYRFGLPGRTIRAAHRVQANGQCFFARRTLLVRTDAFGVARDSRCDDVTIARELVRAGARIGFYEGSRLATVTMYDDALSCWQNWPRSLPLRDRSTSLVRLVFELAEVLAAQGLPLAIVVATVLRRRNARSSLFRLNVAFLAIRLGVLAGTRRAYGVVPWTYWLAPALDFAAALRLIHSAFGSRFVWRGRTLVTEGPLI